MPQGALRRQVNPGSINARSTEEAGWLRMIRRLLGESANWRSILRLERDLPGSSHHETLSSVGLYLPQ